jgi:hypothetical protein
VIAGFPGSAARRSNRAWSAAAALAEAVSAERCAGWSSRSPKKGSWYRSARAQWPC